MLSTTTTDSQGHYTFNNFNGLGGTGNYNVRLVVPAGLRQTTPNPSTILIGRDDNAIVATAMVGHDGHRGWVYYVATDPQLRAKGYGRAIMNAAEDWLRAAGVPKLQLLVRPENSGVAAFYQSIGFGEQQILFFTKWLDGREPPR